MTNPRFQTPRAAYVHVPFCRHRCGYCNFTVVAGRDDLIGAYLEALQRELSWLNTPREVETLFIGGGTPTHLSGAGLDQLLRVVLQWFPLAADGEITVEANPVDMTPERAEILQHHGVTRLSLGVQSFDNGKLQVLERDHRRADVEHAFRLARSAVSAVSLDMMFGVPGESIQTWQTDLESALALGPDHVSTYGLTFERGARFWSRLGKGQLECADEDLEGKMYERAIDVLTEAGFRHYEVSNFARVDRSSSTDADWRCRHNEVYWTGRTYYAAGPGAARFVDGRREVNHRSTTMYLRRILAGQSPVAESESLDAEAAARECLVFGMRRLEGVKKSRFASETGFSVEALCGNVLRQLIEQGAIIEEDDWVRLTRSGLLVSDAIWPRIL
ncbi:MAG: radical SAM family heme chaperone HemW [Pirellulaceae bacterium]|nr:radical SAM family heme chaperone HemW [Pirellulaceae bacterium]